MADTVKKTQIKKNASGGIIGIGTVQMGSGTLEWYKATEQTRYVLNNAIAGYMHQRLAEKRKTDSDQAAIRRLTRKINQIVRITRDPANFQSIARMQQLMEQYAQ